MVKQGLALRRERRDAEALEEFRRAYALDPAPRTLAQIALAEQALGRWVESEAHLLSALQASTDPWIAANRGVLAGGLGNIQGHLGSLEVDADVPGAELWVNSERVGSLPLAKPLRVEAGSLVVEVRAAGYSPARRMTSVEPGGSARESVHLVAIAPPPVSHEPSPAPVQTVAPSASAFPPTRRTIVDPSLRGAAIVFLASGAVGLAAGSYFGVRTLGTKSDRDAQCMGPGGTCTPAGVNLDGQARMLAVRSTAWIAAGLACAGAGVLLWAESRSVAVGVGLGQGSALAGVEGTW
jgi:hypothetical protein